ncbi:unnamed protein product [Nesidiocoris tenuis]|uniref:Uncharacterized protein n=1 Tax=Nesidiocoris tenuis TaxID=355587 RepID=A0A6H5HA48_9HEMI|nr:unnamed protein product [Nesidiocoris tenuis]
MKSDLALRSTRGPTVRRDTPSWIIPFHVWKKRNRLRNTNDGVARRRSLAGPNSRRNPIHFVLRFRKSEDTSSRSPVEVPVECCVGRPACLWCLLAWSHGHVPPMGASNSAEDREWINFGWALLIK